MTAKRLIWARERRNPDTGHWEPDTDQTPCIDKGYGPVQGSRMIRIPSQRRTLCVDTRDLWVKTPDGFKRAEV